MLKFKLDEKKAISTVLYISKKLIDLKSNKSKTDLHKIFKILYFADQKHLARYGRPIVGDYYVAMKDGPVPSYIYDVIKHVRDDSSCCNMKEDYSVYFEVVQHFVHPKQDPDLDIFSDSDLECLDESIKENKFKSFGELIEISHDAAYKRASKDDRISFKDIAEVGGADAAMIKYIQTVSENERTLDE